MKDHVTDLNPSPRNARNSEGSFVTLASGRILFAYTRYRGGGNDHDKAVIAARFSDDGGRTWSKRDRILISGEGKANDMSVSFLRLRDDRIALFNLRKDGLFDCRPMVRFSDDEGKTFTRGNPITPVPGYYILNNDRVVQLKSGRLIAPLAMHHARTCSVVDDGKPATRAGFARPGLVLFLCSDDGGATWFEADTRLHHCDAHGRGLQEPGFVELKRGKLWAYCRHGSFARHEKSNRQWESFSRDDGMHWSDVEPSRFRSPCSPMSVKRIAATGDLLAVWNDHSPGHYRKAHRHSAQRTPLACAISKDEGKTWRHHQLLETSLKHGFCYVAIHPIDDAVLLGYCAGGADTGGCLNRLRIRRISLEKLYA